MENVYLDRDLIDITNKGPNFLFEIEAKIDKEEINCYIKSANEYYCEYVKVEKNKIIDINIDYIDDEFKKIYYQIIEYLFKNSRKDVLNLYIIKDDKNMKVISEKEVYMCSNEKEFYQIMACVLERKTEHLKIFIVVRDISKEIDTISEINKLLDINNYQDKIMNISGVISNLSHSWRQPLNSLNFSIINLIDEIDNKTVDNKLVDIYYNEIWQIIKNLSWKIEKFNTFFKIDYKKKEFNIKKYLDLVFEIMEEKIKKENIQLHIDIEEDLKKYGSPNEFVQIMYCIFFDIFEHCRMNLDTYNRILNIEVNSYGNKVFINIKVIFDKNKYSDFKLDLRHISTFNNILTKVIKGNINLINDETENKVKVSFPLDK